MDEKSLLFKIICNLKLHLNTSHRRLPQLLVTLKSDLEKEFNNLNEHDYTNIVEAYINIPHTLDLKLLIMVKNQITLLLKKNKFSFHLDVLIRYLGLLSQLRSGV